MKGNFKGILLTLVLAVAISVTCSVYLLPLFQDMFFHSYSTTNCVTDMVTNDMSILNIASLYIKNNATVAVYCESERADNSAEYGPILGSGVCVASNGYQTTMLDENITASRGSYIATNYHVISVADNKDLKNCQINIVGEDENVYAGKLVWFDKDLDLALIYTENNFNYVQMADKIVDCDETDKFDIEEVFAIGTPIDLSYLNRVTTGNIARNDTMVMVTAEEIYLTGGLNYSTIKPTNYLMTKTVLSNVYEDVLDVTVGITSGNSGGGCFDGKGNLIGLTTLGTDVSVSEGNELNAIVPIYPIMQVLDRVIANNERGANYQIYSLKSLNIYGIDAYEASVASTVTVLDSYYLDGRFYSVDSYAGGFGFNKAGYYILSSSNGKFSDLTSKYITSARFNDKEYKIEDRNDLIYLLLKLKAGDSITLSYYNSLGIRSTKTITL